jgi:hypothetical protein
MVTQFFLVMHGVDSVVIFACNREKMAAPSIAKDYWRLPENAMIKDVLYAVRSDESTHRFVNHSLGNLEPDDINPFAIREPDMHVKGRTIEYASSPCS